MCQTCLYVSCYFQEYNIARNHMATIQTICINVQPIPKSRPRFTSSGQVYTASRTRNYEQCLKTAMKEQMLLQPFEKAVSLDLTFVFTPIKDKRKQKLIPNGDIDNLVKSVQDAANGILYIDDKQVNHLTAHKMYGDESKIVIKIWETIDDVPSLKIDELV